MKKFYVDFSGWTEIEAESAEEAKDIFWEDIYKKVSIPMYDVEIDCLEEEEEED